MGVKIRKKGRGMFFRILWLVAWCVQCTDSQLTKLSSHVNNSWLLELDRDPEENVFAPNKKPRNVLAGHYVEVKPTPLPDPLLVSYSKEFMNTLGLSTNETIFDPMFTKTFSGHPTGVFTHTWASPYALSIYGNEHTPEGAGPDGYGYGDGRAISLAEVVVDNESLELTRDGVSAPQVRQRRFELQMKGAGRTPFSRGGDGKSVLRSSIREFLVSEAMHHLGVPTSRALALVASTTETTDRPWYKKETDSGDSPNRDYINKHGGNVMNQETTAITTRAATSFIRIGSFELYSRRLMKPNQSFQVKRQALIQLAKLLLHTLKRECGFYPDAASLSPPQRLSPRLDEVLTPYLIVNFAEMSAVRLSYLATTWIRVGYTQSNWNSDNCHVAGITLDYGPFGFIEKYDPKFVMWVGGGEHYSFMNQIKASHQNYKSLIKALFPLLLDVKHLSRNKNKRQTDNEPELIDNVCGGSTKKKNFAIASLRKLEETDYEKLASLEFHAMLASKLGLIKEVPKQPQVDLSFPQSASTNPPIQENKRWFSELKRSEKKSKKTSQTDSNTGVVMNIEKGQIYKKRVAYLDKLWQPLVGELKSGHVYTSAQSSSSTYSLENVVHVVWSELESLMIETGVDWTIFWHQLAEAALWITNEQSMQIDAILTSDEACSQTAGQVLSFLSASFFPSSQRFTSSFLEDESTIFKRDIDDHMKIKWVSWIKSWLMLLVPRLSTSCLPVNELLSSSERNSNHNTLTLCPYLRAMFESSPKFIPREWMLVDAYEEAEKYFRHHRQQTTTSTHHFHTQQHDSSSSSINSSLSLHWKDKDENNSIFKELENLRRLFLSPYAIETPPLMQEDKLDSFLEEPDTIKDGSSRYYRLPPVGSERQGGVGFMS